MLLAIFHERSANSKICDTVFSHSLTGVKNRLQLVWPVKLGLRSVSNRSNTVTNTTNSHGCVGRRLLFTNHIRSVSELSFTFRNRPIRVSAHTVTHARIKVRMRQICKQSQNLAKMTCPVMDSCPDLSIGSSGIQDLSSRCTKRRPAFHVVVCFIVL